MSEELEHVPKRCHVGEWYQRDVIGNDPEELAHIISVTVALPAFRTVTVASKLN